MKINEGETETEHNEQEGVKLLAESLFAAFHNSAAHEPGLGWRLSEQDVESVSLIDRRVDI